MPDDSYQFAVRLRLGLPLAVTDTPCRVFNNSTRRPCGCLLTAMVDHAPGCAKAARNNRHNNLRDWWLAVIREAGGRALHEQAMHEYAPHRRQRSDVRASYGPGAPTVYYDVVVAHPFTTGVPRGTCGELKVDEPRADAAI